MLIMNEKVFRRTLMMYLAGTRGGGVRLRILVILKGLPCNTNELSTKLSLDYKTVQYHLRVMEKANLITSTGKKYKNNYELSPTLRANRKILDEIWEKLNKGLME